MFAEPFVAFRNIGACRGGREARSFAQVAGVAVARARARLHVLVAHVVV
jgi:hypothetical protein